MEKEKILECIESAYYKVAKEKMETNPSDWWPGHNEQAKATSWIWQVVKELIESEDFGDVKQAKLAALYQSRVDDAEGEFRRDLMKDWSKSNQFHEFEEAEVLLDFTLLDWESYNHVLLSAESEMYAKYGVGGSVTHKDNYSWDFYKLLLVPSPRRLFFARVGTSDGSDAEKRIDKLVRTLKEMIISPYAHNLLREGDQLAIFIFPETGSNDMWTHSRFFFWKKESSGVLPEFEKPWEDGTFKHIFEV